MDILRHWRVTCPTLVSHFIIRRLQKYLHWPYQSPSQRVPLKMLHTWHVDSSLTWRCQMESTQCLPPPTMKCFDELSRHSHSLVFLPSSLCCTYLIPTADCIFKSPLVHLLKVMASQRRLYRALLANCAFPPWMERRNAQLTYCVESVMLFAAKDRRRASVYVDMCNRAK